MNASPKKTSETTRLATWVDGEIVHRMKVRAAVDGRSLRSIIEEALHDWIENHPVDADELNRLSS